jgi:glutathione S-transferase
MFKLHGHPISAFTRRVRIAFAEKGVDYDFAVVDLSTGQHRAAGYLAVNPYGRVPALDHDGFVLYESTAILRYLEALHPATPLYPADPRGIGLVEMHTKLCDLELANPGVVIAVNMLFVPEPQRDQPAMAKARDCINRHLGNVDKQLTGREYLVGDRFGAVDVCYAPFLELLPVLGFDVPPAVAAWAARLTERPSVLKTRAPKP